MSQKLLAKHIDVSRQTLNAIERGQSLPPLEVAHRIAYAFECNVDDVLHYESEFPPKDKDDGTMTVIVRIDYDPD